MLTEAVDYFKPISRHGNTALIHGLNYRAYVSPLSLFGNIPNSVDRQLYVKAICDWICENPPLTHNDKAQFSLSIDGSINKLTNLVGGGGEPC